jgi:uncharacterized protein (TIGR00369 family)
MTREPRDPSFEQRVRTSFGRQAAMATLGATLARVRPGEVAIELPFRQELTQQHGFLHAGIATTVMDSACGYAALTLMDPGAAVLTVEFKVNLLAPARGDQFGAVGRVVRAGRTLTVVSGEFRTMEDGAWSVVAIITATMMAVTTKPGVAD